jgi:ABC transporter DrrB family efflux protein
MTAESIVRARSDGGLRQAVRDGLIIAGRNLKRVPRIPELAIFAIMQSIMFVLLFAYVFGGAIPLPGGGSYREFLIPGIFAQTVVFAAATTAIGICEDINKGLMDRFRSLPMARSAVLSGRAIFDVVYQFGILIVLMLTGIVVGWWVNTGVLEFLAGIGLLMLFVFAMSWVGIWLGTMVPTVEVANNVSFTVILPITFLSNVFVPPETLPGVLETLAEWNPTSSLTASLRELWGNPNPYGTDSFAAEQPILLTLIWIAIIVSVFAPLAVKRFRSLSR